MNFCGFKCLLEGQGRQYRGHSLGKHTFSAAGRTYQQCIVTSCGGYFKCLFRQLLTADVREVEDLVVCCIGRSKMRRRRKFFLVPEVQDKLLGIAYCVNVDTVDNGSLGCVVVRDENGSYAEFACKHDHWQNSVYSSDITVERYLADERAAVRGHIYEPHGFKKRHKNSHIVDRAALSRICRSKIYHDRGHGKAYAA